MSWKSEWKALTLIIGGFAVLYHLPVGSSRFDGAVLEALHLAKWYAQEHVLLCLVPAFFIAGAIAVFISGASVMRYLGAEAPKLLAYGVASVSGTILAVCSCTVLPLFAGIYRMGAGLGPAAAFLYSGPAINVLAIILTARVLGIELGIARAVGAVVFAVVIGLAMHLIFRRRERAEAQQQAVMPGAEASRPLWVSGVHFALLVAVLVFANWGAPGEDAGAWAWVFAHKWQLTAAAGVALGGVLVAWLGLSAWKALAVGGATLVAAVLAVGHPVVPFTVAVIGLSLVISKEEGELGRWFESSWGFAKQILPLLFVGVLVAGALLGRSGGEGLIVSDWVSKTVGGNSLLANLFASLVGAFMYFATLTEVPILEGLLANGMGQGPALALLLAGPAVSLPNMLVISSVIGWKKTSVFIALVVVMATSTGFLYGSLFA
jgi:uncharacterized membrane protein YraQ (UPF0718 family)